MQPIHLLTLLLVVAVPILWAVSEFQDRRWLRLTLGSAAIALSLGVAFLIGALERLNSNAWFGSASKELVDTAVSELEAGRQDRVLESLKQLQREFAPTYENRARYDVLVQEAVRRMRSGEIPEQTQSEDSHEARADSAASNRADDRQAPEEPTSPDEARPVIRIGDSLAGAIEKLRQHGVSVTDATEAIIWADGKDRRLHQVSKSRRPEDALVLVALHKPDGTDSEIEGMYWDIDFIKQYVPKSNRPQGVTRFVESVDLSELVAPLKKP